VAVHRVDAGGRPLPFPFFNVLEDGPVAVGWLRVFHPRAGPLRHRSVPRLRPGETVPVELETGPSDVTVEQIMEAQLRLRLYPEARAALDGMGRGRWLAVLSNGYPEALEALLRMSGVRDRFEQVVSAHEVGVFKPAPAVYRLALDHLQVEARRPLVVSANGCDSVGAAVLASGGLR
jgi:FMN phosphatase YigB (HAD superfamily)